MSDVNPYDAPAADLQQEPGDQPFRLAETSRSNPIGSGWSWIAEGFGYFRQSWLAWILAMLLGFLIIVVVSLIPFVSVLFELLTTYIWIAGLALGCRAQAEGEDFRVSYLWAGFKKRVGTLILLSLIYYLAIFAIAAAVVALIAPGLLTGAGEAQGLDDSAVLIAVLISMLFIIPLVMAVFFAPHLIVLNDVPLFRAMKLSFLGCLKNILPFLWWGILITVFMVIAAIPVGLGLLVLVPVSIASVYVAYEDIFLEK
jgi:hypothetical protein